MRAEAIAITFGASGNCAQHIGAGWSGPEPGHRWSDGISSEITLPPLSAGGRMKLTLVVWPLTLEGVAQTMSLAWNGVVLGEPFTPQMLEKGALAIVEACTAHWASEA